eukprot:CAMPEP_0194267404 /NCGR_PEP_ID=MMETSP0169-20130528/1914_1 /TAXON_ID=218684 /ORGANISM="Corethron pennatum, Strain L29A3" /LENGTH=290 /DNA_ID=CAMNT_0039008229 /DNA_START=905 /DNA_END=1777 /DNA_ORIENTATION=-
MTLSLGVLIIGVYTANLASPEIGLTNELIEAHVRAYNCILGLLIFMAACLQNFRFSYVKHEQLHTEIGHKATTMVIGIYGNVAYFLLMIMMLLHGLQPYFGASTIGVFSMYSNLQPYVTTNGKDMNRHLFMPRAVSALQGKQIKILESTTSSTFLCAVVRQDRPEIRDQLSNEAGTESRINYTPAMHYHQVAIGNSFAECHDYESSEATLKFKPYLMTKSHFLQLLSAQRIDQLPSIVEFQDMTTNSVHTLHLPIANYDSISSLDNDIRTQSVLYTVPFFEDDPVACYTA